MREASNAKARVRAETVGLRRGEQPRRDLLDKGRAGVLIFRNQSAVGWPSSGKTWEGTLDSRTVAARFSRLSVRWRQVRAALRRLYLRLEHPTRFFGFLSRLLQVAEEAGQYNADVFTGDRCPDGLVEV